MRITTSVVFNALQCPTRIYLDEHEDPARRDQIDAMTALLWQMGALHQEEVANQVPTAVNLADVPPDRRAAATMAEMEHGTENMRNARIIHGDRMADIDLLCKDGPGYVPRLVRNGSCWADGEIGKPVPDYAIMLAHQASLMTTTGYATPYPSGVVIGHDGEAAYDLTKPASKTGKTWMERYEEVLGNIRLWRDTEEDPALAAKCKMCHWHSRCKARVEEQGDLSLIAELGRAKRDLLKTRVKNVAEMARADLSEFVKGKKTIWYGIGPETLSKFQRRAELLVNPQRGPYAHTRIELPDATRRLMLDVEADPFRDLVYLHGVLDQEPQHEAYRSWFMTAPTPEEEARQFRAVWVYLTQAVSEGASVYHYSAYERTAYRALAKRHPGVCGVSDVEQFFALPNVVDLYQVVKTNTEWPCYDRSIKTLARFAGFDWRDTNPSGAASIGWFHDLMKTGDPAIQKRITDYNEDDCRAMAVVLNMVRTLPVRAA